MPAFHGPGDFAGDHAVDDLNPIDHLTFLDNFQARPLGNQIIHILFH